MKKAGTGLKLAAVLAALAALGLIVLTVCSVVKDRENRPAAETPPPQTASPVTDTAAGSGDLTVDGVRYRRKRSTEAILVLGIDRREETADTQTGGQSDVLMLLVLDRAEKSFRVLQLNRDTVTMITVPNADGTIASEKFAPICLSHAYGSGGADSCENTVRSVNYLLSDNVTDGYFALDLSSVGVLNDAVGGVTLTMQEDLTILDPAFQKGAEVTLNATQAEAFLRARMNLGEDNNENRMVRQRQYLEAWRAQAGAKIAGDGAFALRLLRSLTEIAVTDLTEKRLTALADDLSGYTFAGTVTIAGEDIQGLSYNEFYADSESLLETLLLLFYEAA